MEKKMYFDEPTQVIWYDEEGNRQFGIAYKDEIICACCGGVYKIEDILLRQPQTIKEWKYWVDFRSLY